MFTVAELVLVRRDAVLLRLDTIPYAYDVSRGGDALNPSTYSWTGPGSVHVLAVEESLEDGAAFVLQLSGPLAAGTWELHATGLSTPSGEPPSSVSAQLVVPAVLPPQRLVPATRRTGYDAIRQIVGQAHQGKNWEALIKALGWSEERTARYGRAATEQLFLDTAAGRWLGLRSALNGLPRDELLGLGDAGFRRLGETFVWGKLTKPGLWTMLDCLYGPDYTRAVAVAELSEPYPLLGGEVLRCEAQGTTSYLSVSAPVLDTPGSASAASVAAALNYSAEQLGTAAYFDVLELAAGNYLRCTTCRIGDGARLRFLGGNAQTSLRMPARIAAYTTGAQPTWTIAAVPLEAASTWTCTDPNGQDLADVWPGDYAVVTGTEFAAANRGTFTVLEVSIVGAAGSRTQVLKISNPAPTAETVAQVRESSALFFRPTVVARSSYGPRISGGSSALSVSLPTTGTTSSRRLATAAYLHDRDELLGTATRLLGTTTFAVTAHGLAAGALVDVSSAAPIFSSPTVTPASAGTTASSVTSIWSDLDPMSTSRSEHTATLLDPTTVLAVGGYDGASYLDSCERFTVTGDTTVAGARTLTYAWSAAGTMPHLRGRHAAAQLLIPAGAVLVAGGYDGATEQADLYLYDPVTDTWSIPMTLVHARQWCTATTFPASAALANRVWIVGGLVGGVPSKTTEIYDPVLNTLTPTTLQVARYRHAATYVTLDTVLLSGGLDAAGEPLAHCEGLGAKTGIGPMAWARYGHSLVTLPDGRVLAVGGIGRPAGDLATAVAAVAEVEVLDVGGTWSWSSAGRLPEAVGLGVAAALLAGTFSGLGGATATLRQGERGWTLSRAAASSSPSAAAAAGTDWLLACGGLVGGVATDTAQVLLPAVEAVQGRAPSRFLPIDSVPDANHFTIREPALLGEVASWSTVTIRPVAAEIGGWRGPYLYDPTGGPCPVGEAVTLSSPLLPGAVPPEVATSALLPEGWVVIGFGTARQEGPIRCFGAASASGVRLDPAYVLKFGHPAGEAMVQVLSNGPYEPLVESGGMYLTPSDAVGRVAKELVQAVTGAGLRRSITIRYPGDRGLGAEGWGSGGEKESEAVEVWSGK